MATREEMIAELNKRGVEIPKQEFPPDVPKTPEEERAESLKLSPVGSFLAEEEKSFTDRFVQSVKEQRGELLTAVGATLGSARALPGPAGKAAQAGSAIVGSIAGAIGGRTVEEGIKAAEGGKSTVPEALGRIAEAGRTEALFTGASTLFGPAIKASKPIVGRLLGVGDAKSISDAAERIGVPLGIVDVSNRAVVQGTKTVLGVFPFVSRPFSKSTKAQNKAVIDAKNRYLNSIAPNSSLEDVGVDMVKAARNASEEFKGVTRELYNNADDLARNASVEKLVPSEKIVVQAKELLTLKKRPLLTTGKPLKGKGADELSDFIEQLTDLPENISIDELRTIQFDITDFFNSAAAKGFDIKRLTAIKKATVGALSDIRTDLLPDGEALQIKEAYDTANQVYAQGIQKFQTPTAKRFEGVDKKIFKPGASRTGAIDADELALKVIKMNSPTAIKDLRALVGDKVMKKAASSFIKEVSTRAIRETPKGFVFNAGLLERELGLLEGGKKSIQALDELLKGTGVTAKNITDFIAVSKSVGEVVLPSKMISRRAVFSVRSGLAALTGAAITGGSITQPTSLLFAIPTLLLLRKGARALTNPKTLKEMTRVMDEKISVQTRRNLGVRLLQKAFSNSPDEVTTPLAL